jgi:translation initiation factor 6 (eIF-6)
MRYGWHIFELSENALMHDDLDLIETNRLVAGLLRRRQDAVTSMIALLDLLAMVSGNFPKQERGVIADILRSHADQIERNK